MKKRIVTLLILISFQFVVYGQEFVDSNEFMLTKYDSKLIEKMFSSSGEFDGNTEIYVTDKKGNKLKKIEVFVESYQNDSKVEEVKSTEFTNIKKIIRVIIHHCACYCNTSKYYWLVTNNNDLIELPTIEQEDYEFEMKTVDYVFDSKTNSIVMTEFQDEMIKDKENDNPTFKLKSKTVLKNLKWDGIKLSEK